MEYCQKMVLFGKYVETYTYSEPQKREYKKTLDVEADITDKPTCQLDVFLEHNKNLVRSRFSLQRTRTKIRRLINCNEDMNKFLTLTFADNIIDVKEANYKFTKFVQRLKYEYPNVKYLAVIERQRNRGRKNNDLGTIHYHLLSDFVYTCSDYLADIWGHGFIKVNRISHVDNVGAYVCKYLNKEVFEGDMKGKKKFFHSLNLAKPVEIYGDINFNNMFDFLALSSAEPVYKSTFDSKYTGVVNYKQYALTS
jgi:hypothetical protein